jgi:hypothetical protein
MRLDGVAHFHTTHVVVLHIDVGVAAEGFQVWQRVFFGLYTSLVHLLFDLFFDGLIYYFTLISLGSKNSNFFK